MEDRSMASDPELVSEIRAMREQLIRMDERMNMVQDHETRIRTLEAYNLADHGGRLSALEKWRYALPAALVLAVGSVASQLIPLIGR
jgi:hypothetical protein